VINFINLFSAQSIRRVKEMGIRKSMGGVRANLTIQILCETFMQTLIAVAVSVLLISPTLSVLERFIPDGADFQFLDLRTLSFLLLLILITSILAGIYPARILSAHSPALSLRGIVGPTGKRGHTRKVMVVFQFIISLIFVTAAIVVSNQLRFIQEETRLTTSPILNLKVGDKAKVFADKIRRAEGVVSAAVQAMPPVGLSRIITGVQIKI
jgi:putative ABC transport system permease protein